MQTPQKEREEVSGSVVAPQRHRRHQIDTEDKEDQRTEAASKLFSQRHLGKHTPSVFVCGKENQPENRFLLCVSTVEDLQFESHSNQSWRSSREPAVR